MAAGRVGCGDGARLCIILMGLTLMGYGRIACGLGGCFGGVGGCLANSLGVTAMEAMVRRSTIAMMSIQRKFGVSD